MTGFSVNYSQKASLVILASFISSHVDAANGPGAAGRRHGQPLIMEKVVLKQEPEGPQEVEIRGRKEHQSQSMQVFG